MIPSFFQFFSGLINFIIFCTFLSIIILRGLAFKSLFGEYIGFIPIVGDIACKIKFAQEYENPFKIKYVIVSIITYFLPYGFYNLLFLLSPFFDISKPNIYSYFRILVIFLIIYTIFLIVKLYYNYKIIFPFVYDFNDGKNIYFKTLIFTILPFIFYTWILIKRKVFE